jgi:hypothetical protein
MKHIGLAGAAVLAIALSGPVLAQSVGPTDPARANTTDPNSARVQIAPEQRTRIKEYVAREKVAPVTVQERVRIGSRLPADVELRPVPSDWGPSVSRYNYIYSDSRVYFVDPSNRTIVQEID